MPVNLNPSHTLSFQALDLALPHAPSACKKALLLSLDLAELPNLETIRSLQKQIAIPAPQIEAWRHEPDPRSCYEIKALIEKTVNDTIETIDYNGLKPLLKIMDQLQEGKRIERCRVNSEDEEPASTCVGMGFILLKKIKEKHGIVPLLAVQRFDEAHHFEHAALVIECQDGYVLIDARSNPHDRLFAIRFGQTHTEERYSITATQEPSLSPLTVREKGAESHKLTYSLFVKNGDDIVMKEYLRTHISDFLPVVVYNQDGSWVKCIKVFVQNREIRLMAGDKSFNHSIPFEDLKKADFLPRLQEFMGEEYLGKKFNSSPEEVHQQLLQLVTQEKKIKEVFGRIIASKS